MFKDYGKLGTYNRDINAVRNKQGWGTMTYESGSSYDGRLSDDKFHKEDGTYCWADGEEYSM